MATDNRVELVDPNGNKHMASTPGELNSLVFGSGYKLAGKKTVDEALTQLAEKGPVAEELAAQTTPPPVEPPKK